jgi:hypothetical protein
MTDDPLLTAAKALMLAVQDDEERHGGTISRNTLQLASLLRIQVDRAEKKGRDPFAPVMAEVGRAMVKFPTWPTDPLHAVAVLGEEFGELTKEALQLTYEPHKSTMADFRKEAVQTAAMALRFVASLDRYAFTPGAQHGQAEEGAR